ncbi:MAG: hypothetical protein OEZ39_05595 [Gammaproteobacteria bacterium]|nr:hypothetical protein [Gammaproteobacteria bacterium]MDH5651329.1 hypothetical protein [Gammaproteobacteria bacterium]
MSSKTAILKWLWNKHGLGGVILYISRKLFWPSREGTSSRIFLFVLDKPRPTAAGIEAAKDHLFRFATREDLLNLQQEAAWDIHDRDIAAFDKGDRCLLQLDGDKLVGYAWLAGSQLVEIMWGFHYNMPDDVVYNYKGFTNPEYRGCGFQPLRHLKLLEFVKQQGQHRLFGYVDHLNFNSLRGVRKSGYRKIGSLHCVIKNGQAKFNLKVTDDSWSRSKRT